MKNLLKKGLVFLCVLMLAAAMAACGSDKSEDKKEDKKTEQDAAEETNDTEDTEKDGADEADSSAASETGKFKDLESFVHSDLMQEEMKNQNASLEGTGLVCDLTAEGDKLIYLFTVQDESVAAVMDKATLDSALKEQTDTFTGIAAMLPAAVEGIKAPVVVVRYLDNTGAEITSMEFPAE